MGHICAHLTPTEWCLKYIWKRAFLEGAKLCRVKTAVTELAEGLS